jgi:hypothetical protein
MKNFSFYAFMKDKRSQDLSSWATTEMVVTYMGFD